MGVEIIEEEPKGLAKVVKAFGKLPSVQRYIILGSVGVVLLSVLFFPLLTRKNASITTEQQRTNYAVPNTTPSPSGASQTQNQTTEDTTPSVTPSLLMDKQPPKLVKLPLGNGTVVKKTSTCIPIEYSDNSDQQTQIRYQLDRDPWGNWLSSTSVCLTNLSNGTHTLSTQAQDSNGNQSDVTTVTFTVDVPGNQIPTATPTSTQDDGSGDNGTPPPPVDSPTPFTTDPVT